MAPKIIQNFEEEVSSKEINQIALTQTDTREEEMPSSLIVPIPIPEFILITVFKSRIPLEKNISYIVEVRRLVRYTDILAGVQFDGPSFKRDDNAKNIFLLEILQRNLYTLGMAINITDPRYYIQPQVPLDTTESTTSNPTTTKKSKAKKRKNKKKVKQISQFATGQKGIKIDNRHGKSNCRRIVGKKHHIKTKYQCR